MGSGFGFGNRRLSIIDVAGGHQPISEPRLRYHICYNGELYNFKELRTDLERRGVNFLTRSDTEVVLHSYAEFGPACLDRFVGMYALAIWDSERGSLFLARDRLGIKPLYYAEEGDRLVFSSETRSLQELMDARTTPNPNGISSYLAYRYVIGSQTLYNEIRSLPPGHHLTFEGGEVKVQSYWQLPVSPSPADHGEDYYKETVREKIRVAVKRRLVSDVPVCCFLSGGLDSSIVAYEMADLRSEPTETFAVGFGDGAGQNEFPYARMVAEQCGTEHTEVSMTGKGYLDQLADLVRLRDAPLSVPNEVPIYQMSRELQKNAKVVLSGEGADELFGGYGRIFRSALDLKRAQLLRDGGGVLSGAARDVLSANIDSKYNGNLADDELSHFLGQYDYCSIEERGRWLSDDIWAATDGDRYCRGVFAEAFAIAEPLELHQRYMWVFEKLHLVGLLQRLDSSTMAASVEARVPFVDHELVEFAMSMPLHYKLRWRSESHMVMASLLNSDQISETYDVTKYILRSAYRGRLPDAVIDRKKVGFPVPLDNMGGVDVLDYARTVLTDPSTVRSGLFDGSEVASLLSQPEDHRAPSWPLKVWMLLNLALWHDNQWGSAAGGSNGGRA